MYLCSVLFYETVRRGHKNRHRSGSGKQVLISLQNLETGGRTGHLGPCEGHQVWVRGRKIGRRGKSRSTFTEVSAGTAKQGTAG